LFPFEVTRFGGEAQDELTLKFRRNTKEPDNPCRCAFGAAVAEPTQA